MVKRVIVGSVSVKMAFTLKWLWITVFVAAAWIGVPCCGVGRTGVTFLGQMNIIVWDSVSKREVFVRKASFLTKGDDFGFLAPTPSVPDLETFDVRAFATLAHLEPKDTGPLGCSAMLAAKGGTVRVMKEMDVAGYHAATVRADDAKGLKRWLSENKYGSSPGIEKWLNFYIKKGWYITAFKVAKSDSDTENQLTTGTVKMTFATEMPFNPYYVPAENFSEPVGKRSSAETQLKVYLVADRPFRGVREDKGKWVEADWSSPVTSEAKQTLIGQLKLPASGFGAMNRVTSFTDPNFPQVASGDVYFQPELEIGWVWGVGMVVVIGGSYLLWRRRRMILNPAESSR